MATYKKRGGKPKTKNPWPPPKKKRNNTMLQPSMKKGRPNCVIAYRKSVLLTSNSCSNSGNSKKSSNNNKSVSNAIRNLVRRLMNNAKSSIAGHNSMRSSDSGMVRSFGVLHRGLPCNDSFYWPIIISIGLTVATTSPKKTALTSNWKS